MLSTNSIAVCGKSRGKRLISHSVLNWPTNVLTELCYLLKKGSAEKLDYDRAGRRGEALEHNLEFIFA